MSWRSADEQVEYKSSDLSELSARNREMDEALNMFYVLI